MSSWLNRVLEAAKRDKNLAKKLREIADLDSKINPRGVLIDVRTHARFLETQEGQQMMQRASDLCDEAAMVIATESEDPEKIALWIAHNCQRIVRQLPRRRWPW